MNRVLAAAVGAVLAPVLALTMGVSLLVAGTATACPPPTTGQATSQVGAGTTEAVPSPGDVPPFNPSDIPAIDRSTPPALGAGSLTDCAHGQTVLARAATWLTAWHGGPVPYSMSTNPTDWFHGYRRDCSGYTSMALGLPGPGLTTISLAARATPITKDQLQPGDLLINPATGGNGHVVIFDHWTDPTLTTYLAYEQSGDGGTHHRAIPYPYYGNYPMAPFHWN